MTLKEENEALKEMVIFLAGCYQTNFDHFCCSRNLSQEVKDAVKPETYKIMQVLMFNFSTVQGSDARSLVEELANLPRDKAGSSKKIREIFGLKPDSDKRKKLRKVIYDKHWGDGNKKATIKRLKEIWEDE